MYALLFKIKYMPPTNVAPTPSPASTPAASPTSSTQGKSVTLIIILIVIIILGAGVGYAYYKELGPFSSSAPYKTDELATSIVDGIKKIETAGYSLNLTIASEPREKDAEPFAIAVPQDEKKLEAYKRDLDRARDIQTIWEALGKYNREHGKKYPSKLSDIAKNSVMENPAYTYTSVNEGKDFIVSFTLETSDVLKQLSPRNATTTGMTISITKSSYLNFYLSSKPKPPAILEFVGIQEYLSYIPANFKFDGTLSGASEKVDEKNFDGRMQIMADVDFDDLVLSIDAEFRKVGEDVYVVINKFPSIFYDIANVKGKWIKFTPEELSDYGYGFYTGFFGSSANEAAEEIKEQREKSSEEIKMFLRIADEEKALESNGNPTRDEIDGKTAYKYELKFNKEALPQFYTKLTSELATKFGDKASIKFDQATLDYLKSPEFSAAFDYFRKNTTLYLWAREDGIPIQAQYSIRVVPSQGARGQNRNLDNQIRLTLTLSLNKINESNPTEVPPGAMSLEEFTMIMSGQTKKEYQFDKQIRNIRIVQDALEGYKRIAGVYPKSLEELKISPADLLATNPKLTEDDFSYSYYKNDTQPILKTIPVDSNTSAPFVYRLDGKDYKLEYSIILPEYKAGTNPTLIYSNGYDYTKKVNTITLQAVSGKNTATSKVISLEAEAQSKIDADKDGLPNALETYMGTSVSKKDTDGDTYSDADELRNRTNPLGPGNLISTYDPYY